MRFGWFAGWLLAGVASTVSGQVLLQESFDDQPDWHSGLDDSFGIPEGWFKVRADPTWAPSTGHLDRHEVIEILASNSDKARGGAGKSYVSWRDSYDPGWNRWNSDSILAAYFPEGQEEIYVRFWLRFSPEWTWAGNSKLLRVLSWDESGGESNFFNYFSNGYSGPIMLWGYGHSATYGLRNRVSLRGAPQESNFFFQEGLPQNLPRSMHNGDLSLNFDNNITDLNGDGVHDNPMRLIDLTTGEPLSGAIVNHDQVYASEWAKIEFHLRMNSAPGAADGEMRQWINDALVFRNTTIPWVADSADAIRRWNVVAIGGNDFFQAYPNEERVEEWYAIDDVVIHAGGRPVIFADRFQLGF